MFKTIFVVLTLVATLFTLAFAQDSTAARFESTESTTSGDVMEIVSTVVIVPLAIGSTVIGVVPPSGGLIIINGKASGMLSFETGVGFGEKVDLKRFSDFRLTLGYNHIFSQTSKDFVRLEASKDIHLVYIDRRKIFLFGFSPSIGCITNFPSAGFSLGASAWLMTPWLSYFGFIPQHMFGVSYRYNKYSGGGSFGEISAGISSAFTWGW